MRRLLIACTLGFIAFMSLGVLVYFPQWWSLTFAFIAALLAYWFPRAAIILLMAIFGIPLAYYSLNLFMLYLLVVIFTATVSIKMYSFPEVFLLVAAAPFLAAFNISGYPFPLEFIIIFLSPILLLNPAGAAIASGAACLFCCLVGIIGKQEFFGNLIIGVPIYKFLPSLSAPESFYNFSWATELFTSFDTKGVSEIFGKLLKFSLCQPLIFLQAIGWATISFFIAALLGRRKLWLDIIAGIAGTGALILLQFSAVYFYPEKIDFNFTNFSVAVGATVIIFLIFWEIKNIFTPATITPGRQETGEETAATSPRGYEPVPESIGFNAEAFRFEKLSLEDSLKMQKNLQEYINKKFVHEITAIDIDVVESAKLKSGESQEGVMVAFKLYWKTVDGCVQKRQGKFLNRSGDGAIYVFQSADQALYAALDILKELERFNKSVNTLKAPFIVRIGLNTGKIVADTEKTNTEIFSAVLDIAGHLQKIAKPGEILVSEHTYLKLRNKNDFETGPFSEKDYVQSYAYKRKDGSSFRPQI